MRAPPGRRFVRVSGGWEHSLGLLDDGSVAEAAAVLAAERAEEEGGDGVEELLQIDRVSLEIGYRLISLVETGRHGFAYGFAGAGRSLTCARILETG